MNIISSFLWQPKKKGGGQAAKQESDSSPPSLTQGQPSFSSSLASSVDRMDVGEKSDKFSGDSAYNFGGGRRSMDTSGTGGSSRRRSMAFSSTSSMPSHSSSQQALNTQGSQDGEGMSGTASDMVRCSTDMGSDYASKMGDVMGGHTVRNGDSAELMQGRAPWGEAPHEEGPSGAEGSFEAWGQRRASVDSQGGASTRSGRSSFALERASFEVNRKSLEMFGPPRPSMELATADTSCATLLCEQLGLTGVLKEHYLNLCIVPNDTPLPMTMLARLWRTTEEDAEASANLLEQSGVMRVACLYDGSAWALVAPEHLQALQAACAGTAVAKHQRLLAAYLGQVPGGRSQGSKLAEIADDGYILQNLGHHLACANRLSDLRSLLAQPTWLQQKLLSYGTAAVVADFRRYLMSQADEEVKMLLEAFQMSVAACLAHPQFPILRAQMAGRLIAVQVAKQMKGSFLGPAADEDMPLQVGGPVRCLETKTGSLEQAGGLQRMTLRGHTAGVQKVLLTPGGIDVITVSTDGTGRVWDLEIGDCMLLLQGHSGALTDMAVTNNGAILVTASCDATARVWELERGECVFVLAGHTGPVNGVAMDAEGRIAITVSSDGTARLWDLSTGICRQVMQHMSDGLLCTVSRVALTPDSRMAVTASEDFLARVWELSRGTCLGVLTGHTGWVVDVVVTPDGQHCITASHDFTAIVWQLPNYHTGPEVVVQPLHRLIGHSARVNAVRVTAMGTTAVTASDDFTARIWDWKTGACREILAGHGAWVSSVALANSGTVGITVSGDETGAVWDLTNGACLNMLEGHSGEVRSVVLTRHGRFAVTGSEDGTGRVWDLHARMMNSRRTHTGRVHCLVQNPEGDNVISVGNNGALVWDPSVGECKAVLTGEEKSPVRWASVARDGELLITCCADRTVHVWDLQMGKLLRTLPAHRGSRVKSFAASGDGSIAVIVLFDSTVSVWDLDTLECRHRLQRWGDRNALHVHSSAVNAGYLAVNATNVVTVSKDSTARVWDLDTGSCIHVLLGHTDGIEMASLDAQGDLAMTVSYDNTARIWDLLHGECLGLVRQEQAITLGALSPDGNSALLAFADHSIALWDLQSNCLVHNFMGHTGEITSLTWAPDSIYAASTSQDWTLRMWDTRRGNQCAFFMGDSALTCSIFTGGSPPDTLVTGSERGIVHFLSLPPWPQSEPQPAALPPVF